MLLELGQQVNASSCCKQATKNKQEVAFYSIPEFEEWKKQTENYKSWHIKYYKGSSLRFESAAKLLLPLPWKPNGAVCFAGLGTSTSKEAKEYFAEMEKHRITFRYSGAEDDAAITLVSLTQTHPSTPPPLHASIQGCSSASHCPSAGCSGLKSEAVSLSGLQ